jgi:hypothetical protein
MEYNKISIDEVVGRIIRNTKVQDTAYFPDILIWITEAMADMQTKWVLRQVFADADVYFYKAEMPCGLVVLSAVEYEGKRLQQRNVSRHPSTWPTEVDNNGVFISTVKIVESPNGNNTYQQETAVIPLEMHPSAWYQEDGPGFIAASFKEGRVRFHYKETPHDKHGWPLIPDQENYKEALYWYVRMKLIESGWLDPVFNWDTCDAKYSINAERGKAATRFPSTNRAEEMCDMITLIPPQNYFDTFGNFYNTNE